MLATFARSVGSAVLLATLVIAAGSTMAQDEMVEADLASYARVEIPEAGIAISFPPDWSVDIEMDQREDFELSEEIESAAPVIFWNVLYASAGGRPWCDLVWYPDHPLSMSEHADLFVERMLPDPDVGVERTVETTAIDLAVGDAYRFDIYNEPSDDFSVAHLFDSGEARYLLRCVADTFEGVDRLQISQTIEFLEGGVGEPLECPPA